MDEGYEGLQGSIRKTASFQPATLNNNTTEWPTTNMLIMRAEFHAK